jgi:hypothetical protein
MCITRHIPRPRTGWDVAPRLWPVTHDQSILPTPTDPTLTTNRTPPDICVSGRQKESSGIRRKARHPVAPSTSEPAHRVFRMPYRSCSESPQILTYARLFAYLLPNQAKSATDINNNPVITCSLCILPPIRYSYANVSRTLTRVALSAGHALAIADSTTTIASHSSMPLMG